MSFNRCILEGRVGKDPEIRRFNDGREVANFSLATSETWRDKQSGERKEKTYWHNISVKNENVVKIVRQYVSKGSNILIEGQLQTRDWEKDGTKHYTTEVVLGPYDGRLVLIGSKPDGARDEGRDGGSADRSREPSSNDFGSDSRGGNGAGRSSSSYAADLDDDIPF